MRILTRYVLIEFLVPLFYCVTGFVSIYVLFELFGSFGRLTNASPDMGLVVKYFIGYLAPFLKWVMPACLMLATLYTMWSFCRHSELIAMRAGGVGFFAIVKPLLGVAIVAAGFISWVNESYVPRVGQWAKSFRAAHFRIDEMSSTDFIMYDNVNDLRTWKIKGVLKDDLTVLDDVTVAVAYSTGGRNKTIQAPRAEYKDGQWWFYNPIVTYYDKSQREIPSPTPELDKLTLRCFPEFNEEPRDLMMQGKSKEFCSASDYKRFIEKTPHITPIAKNENLYNMWAQLLSPLACLVITLFAIPAGVATGRQSVFKGVLTALGMFLCFYAVTIGCQIVAQLNYVPAIVAATFPHILFLCIGGYMFYRQR